MTDTLTPEQIAYVRELTYGIRNGDGQHVEDELVEWCCKHLDRMLDERAAQARRIEELEAALDKSALNFCKLENERVFLEAENARLREKNRRPFLSAYYPWDCPSCGRRRVQGGRIPICEKCDWRPDCDPDDLSIEEPPANPELDEMFRSRGS